GWVRLDRACIPSPLALGSRALDMLLLLAQRPGEIVGKDEIMRTVWPGLAVEDSNLTVQISTLRRILDRDPARGSCIQTLPRRGYRFTATVSRPDEVVAAPSRFALPDKPSIAVLPFANLSGDPEQEYFAD